MKEKIDNAVKYASDSNKLENNTLTEEEIKQIVTSIANNKSKKSFLKAIVDDLKTRKEEAKHGKSR